MEKIFLMDIERKSLYGGDISPLLHQNNIP